MWEAIKFLLKAIWPTRNPDQEVQMGWRIAVALSQLLVIGILAFSFAWAQGHVPNLPGVATKQDIKDIRESVQGQLGVMSQQIQTLGSRQNAIELLDIRQAMKNSMIDLCLAVEQHNQRALDSANTDLDRESEVFERLTREPYQRQDCATVLIKPNK